MPERYAPALDTAVPAAAIEAFSEGEGVPGLETPAICDFTPFTSPAIHLDTCNPQEATLFGSPLKETSDASFPPLPELIDGIEEFLTEEYEKMLPTEEEAVAAVEQLLDDSYTALMQPLPFELPTPFPMDEPDELLAPIEEMAPTQEEAVPFGEIDTELFEAVRTTAANAELAAETQALLEEVGHPHPEQAIVSALQEALDREDIGAKVSLALEPQPAAVIASSEKAHVDGQLEIVGDTRTQEKIPVVDEHAKTEREQAFGKALEKVEQQAKGSDIVTGAEVFSEYETTPGQISRILADMPGRADGSLTETTNAILEIEGNDKKTVEETIGTIIEGNPPVAIDTQGTAVTPEDVRRVFATDTMLDSGSLVIRLTRKPHQRVGR